MKKPRFSTAISIMVITTLVIYALGCRMIYSSVKKYADEARAIYGGETVPALIALLEDESAPFEKRNSAIWALGQIGDKRALPVLKKYDTDEQQKPPYDSTKYIVQYSVEKAIRQLNEISVTRWMYRSL